MGCIVDKLQSTMSDKTITSKIIWEQLNKWYNLQQLDENEPQPPHLKTEVDFTLPDSDYGTLKQKKLTPKLMNPTVPIINTAIEKPTKVATKETPSLTKKDLPKPIIEIKKEKDASSEKSVKSTTSSSSSSSTPIQRRDSVKETPPPSAKKEVPKKEAPSTPLSSGKKIVEKRGAKGRPPSNQGRMTPTSSKLKDEEGRSSRERNKEEFSNKRTTRGSLRPDDALSDHSKSPLTVTPNPNPPKRRRI